MRKSTLRYLAGALIVAAAMPLFAGSPKDGIEPLSKDVKSTTIAELTKEMKDVYFFQDLAAKVEEDLNRRSTAGEYDAITSGEDFAKKLADDMRLICGDAHLRVRFSKDVLPVRK